MSDTEGLEPLLRVLVAVDGSGPSMRASRFVTENLARFSEVLAINVSPIPVPYHPVVGWGIVRPWAATADVAQTAEVIESRSEQLRSEGDRVIDDAPIEPDERIVEIGDSTERVLEAARDHHVGVIVLGASDGGPLHRLLHGSTTSELLRTHEFPVLVVP